MQGAFPPGADWSRALDPEADDAVQIKEREDQITREIERLTRIRAPGAAPGPAPPANPLLNYSQVFPPSAHFQLSGVTYYIVKGRRANDEASVGWWGHYTVATADVRVGSTIYARPFLNARSIPGPRRVAPPLGAPGTQGDGLPPAEEYCAPGRDYIVPDRQYWEIGLQYLTQLLETAEAKDLAFARRMEGLGNVAPQVCWDCLDPDYDPSDRSAVMDQFMGKYLDRFYSGIDAQSGPRTELVADEALHKHKSFCQAWARKHYKPLTPAVTAPAEALASEFYPYIEQQFPQGLALTRAELARILMRFEDTAAEFASCLHYYSSSLEQARGGRNASYKQMSTVSAYRAVSYKRFGDLLADKLPALRRTFQLMLQPEHRRFHPLVVDWHAILGQMPQVHRYFQNTSLVQGLYKRARRSADDDAHIPPWDIGRRRANGN